jgi:ATP-dependent Clp protease, proteolytic subunit ClpP
MNIKEIFSNVKLKSNIARLDIYGDIVSSEWDAWSHEDTYPSFVSGFLEDIKDKELHVHINSGGGSAFAGVAIYNLLKAREGKTVVHIDALAASAASVIALSGDEIRMPAGSMLMIHEPWSWVAGNSTELKKEAENLDKICESMISIYNEHLINDGDTEKIAELVRAESWLSADECKELFKNVIVENDMKAVACIKSESMMHYKIPKVLMFADSETKSETEGKSEAEIKKMLMEIEIEEML